MAKVVTQLCLNILLYVHCLPYLAVFWVEDLGVVVLRYCVVDSVLEEHIQHATNDSVKPSH
jgi:hypothetical protein